MTQNSDFFTPESVDEQVEQLSLRQPGEPVRLETGGAPAQAERPHSKDLPANKDGQDAPSRLVKELQAFYQADYEQNRAFLARARQRIAARQSTLHDINQARSPLDSTPVLHFSQGRTRTMQSPRSIEHSMGKRLSHSLGLLAAVLVAGLLVGTLAVVLSLSHSRQSNQGTSGANTNTASALKPTPTVPIGTILSTHKAPVGTSFNSAAWSPDGKRVAATTIDLNTSKTVLYIWDTASGKNVLTVHLDAMSLGDVLWSPTGKYLSLDNLQTIVILDSQSGTVVKTINYVPPSAFKAPSASQGSWLSSYTPLGGGFGFYSVAWSPDGASLAVAVSDVTPNPTGRVELLDPQTGAVKTTLREGARPVGFPMAFSSNGKELAVSYPNDSTIVIWDVVTKHTAFVLNGVQSMNIAWQPGTHNLARSASNSVELWDVNTHRLIKTYQGFSAFAWSPDGKELAAYALSSAYYPSQQTKPATVTILDAHTGAQMGHYTSKNSGISSASWSPDGHAIATNESSTNSSEIVVWAA